MPKIRVSLRCCRRSTPAFPPPRRPIIRSPSHPPHICATPFRTPDADYEVHEADDGSDDFVPGAHALRQGRRGGDPPRRPAPPLLYLSRRLLLIGAAARLPCCLPALPCPPAHACQPSLPARPCLPASLFLPAPEDEDISEEDIEERRFLKKARFRCGGAGRCRTARVVPVALLVLRAPPLPHGTVHVCTCGGTWLPTPLPADSTSPSPRMLLVAAGQGGSMQHPPVAPPAAAAPAARFAGAAAARRKGRAEAAARAAAAAAGRSASAGAQVGWVAGTSVVGHFQSTRGGFMAKSRRGMVQPFTVNWLNGPVNI